jgi:hypothetical protein
MKGAAAMAKQIKPKAVPAPIINNFQIAICAHEWTRFIVNGANLTNATVTSITAGLNKPYKYIASSCPVITNGVMSDTQLIVWIRPIIRPKKHLRGDTDNINVTITNSDGSISITQATPAVYDCSSAN